MENIIVKKAGKKGKGVFAKKDFKKGECVLRHTYDTKSIRVIDKNEIQKLSQKDQDHLDYIGNNKYVIDYSIVSTINHSCDPNTYVKSPTKKQRIVIALRDIKKGEEITFEYGIDASDPWVMKCYCDSPKCRKIIYGNYFKLPLNLQKRYLKYASPKIRKEFKKRQKNSQK